MHFTCRILAALSLGVPALANVEKTIFVAPPPTPLQSEQLDLDDLRLQRLSPLRPSIRTYIESAFPTEEQPQGVESWFYLDGLRPGARYEVRVCWLATQPTAFTMEAYSLTSILDSPSLISSLTMHSQLSSPDPAKGNPNNLNSQPYHKQAARIQKHHLHQSSTDPDSPVSGSFLRVHAAADYFTLNKTLMREVPPVHADLIIDEYLGGIFPASLVPTVGYVVLVAVGAWGVAWVVWELITGVIGEASNSGGVGVRKKRE